MAAQKPVVKVDGKYVELDDTDTLDLNTGQKEDITDGIAAGSGLTQPQVMARTFLGC